jgi:hypothetical protein
MRSQFTLYNAETGEITAIMSGSMEDAELNGPYLEGAFDPDTYTVVDGVAVQKPDSVLEEQEIKKATSKMILLRNGRLKDSDWTQVPDAPVDAAAWAVYRQQLRDLPANTTDPRNVEWPEPPS